MYPESMLFELHHPKHYHMFKGLMDYYKSKDCDITIIARDKDVLLQLLDADNREYKILGTRKDGTLLKLLISPVLIYNYLAIIRKVRPKLLFSKLSPYASLFSKLFGMSHIVFPDSDILKSNDYLTKLADIVVTPSNYKKDYGQKHKRVNGFFENIYLHPDLFKPNAEVLEKYSINSQKKYSVVRFIGWDAYHDNHQKGFDLEEKIKLVKNLNKYGDVYITSEKDLPHQLEKFRLNINPVDIHQILYFSSLYVGDSQSMATESSLLGVPSIRTNTFVGDGDMSNFTLLEEEFGLLYNFSDSESAIEKAIELISSDSSKNEWKKKREAYYNDNRDVFQQVIRIVNGIS